MATATGVYHTTYEADLALRTTRAEEERFSETLARGMRLFEGSSLGAGVGGTC
jgi:alanyl-tRNA synthetase